MNDIFHDYIDQFITVYIDDLLIYSFSIEEHYKHLKLVFEILRKNKLFVRISKYTFFEKKILYLGYIIGNNQIRVDPARISGILNWSRPWDIHELRSFLGLVNTILSFILKLAEHTSSMIDFLKKSPGKRDLLMWTEEHESAFKNLKKIIYNPQVLHIFDPSKSTALFIDWSRQAIGGWIGQPSQSSTEIDDLKITDFQPVSFFSKKLHGAELNYSPYNGELFALIENLWVFRPYLIRHPIRLFTDQKALQWLINQDKLSHRQYRWLDILLEFDLRIQWIPDQWNTLADILSRCQHDQDVGIQVNLNVLTQASTLDEIRRLTQEDSEFQDIIKALQDSSQASPKLWSQLHRYSLTDNLLYYEKDRLYVPKLLWFQILYDFYDAIITDHSG